MECKIFVFITNLWFSFDGHGGVTIAEYCKKRFFEIFLSCHKIYKDIYVAIYFAHELLDKEILLLNNSQKDPRDDDEKILTRMGCTSAIAIIAKEGTNHYLYTANIGDSEIILVRNSYGKHTVETISEIHTPKNEYSRLSEIGALLCQFRIQSLK